MKVRYVYPLLLLVLLAACAGEKTYSDAELRREFLSPPCPHWVMRVFAPRYMEAWVGTLEVKDDRGRWAKIPQGMAGDLGQTVGWGDLYAGGGPRLDNVGATMEVYVRWKSLAEPQTYAWHFTVPASLRQALVKQEQVTWNNQSRTSCRSDIVIGVASGRRTIVWNGGIGYVNTEILRGQAEVEPLGPDQGQHEGRYVRFSGAAKQYVQQHGITYES